ncbi:hypothetical protein J4459_00795 [Candidatus Woesearchaeota archaeon]|nr:hypothetical protein [Candidatus Woesearchaeota archaeon]
MPDVIITYETVYETLRREKFRQEIQQLEPTFFQDVVKYLKEKKAILKSQKEKESIFAAQEIQKTQKQIENIYKILKELYERRETKIIQIALFSSKTNSKLQDPDLLLKEEQELFKKITSELDNFRKNILGNLLEAKIPQIPEDKIQETILKKEENKLIHFSKPVPKFLAEDLQSYGPFEQDEIANLPEKAAEILIQRNKANLL